MSTAPAQPQPTTETKFAPEATLLDRVIDATALKIDSIADAYSVGIANPALGRLRRAALIGAGIAQLRAAITHDFMQKVIMPLMNSQLGFKTDRPNRQNPNPYNEQEVRDCLIAGLLEGVFPFGNEFNIISGSMYIAQAGYRRKVTEIEGLTDLVLSPGVPRLSEGRTVVRYAATWKYQGMDGQLLGPDGKPGRIFTINVNQGMGPDGILGKAERKALKAIYQQVTGTEHTAPDGEVDELGAAVSVPDGASRTEQVAAKLGAGNGQTSEPAPTSSPVPPEEEPGADRGAQELTQDQMCIADDIHEAEDAVKDAATEEQIAAAEEKVAALGSSGHLTPDQWGKMAIALSAKRKALAQPYATAQARKGRK